MTGVLCWLGYRGAGVRASHSWSAPQAYCPTTRQAFSDASKLYYSPQKNSDIRWNWEKFLISKSGKPFMRYDPGTKPDEIRNDIMFLLQQQS